MICLRCGVSVENKARAIVDTNKFICDKCVHKEQFQMRGLIVYRPQEVKEENDKWIEVAVCLGAFFGIIIGLIIGHIINN